MEEIKVSGSKLKERIKELIKEGNVRRIIVRNPAGSASRSGLSAFVQIYDDRGGLLTTGSAPVASAALEPGAESTFVIVVPNADRVERYRVSFRSADNVIPHLDRRAGV